MAANSTRRITKGLIAGANYIRSEIACDIEEEAKSAIRKTRRASAFFSFLSLIANFFKRLGPIINADTSLLSAVPYLSTAISTMAMLVQVFVTGITLKSLHFPTFIIKSGLAVSTSALDISALIVTEVAYPLAIASAAISTFKNLWDIGERLYSYIRGDWYKEKRKYMLLKTAENPDPELLRKSKNKLREQQGELADDIHRLILSVITLIGACMMLTPLAPIGLALMAAVTIYTVLDKFKLNPLRLLANKLFNYPFKPDPAPEITLDSSNTQLLKTLRDKKPISAPVQQNLYQTTLPFYYTDAKRILNTAAVSEDNYDKANQFKI